MFGKIGDWLEHRTGYRTWRNILLFEHIPGGARWRYVWGSCLVFVFLVQLITGVLLMTAYSPGDSTAWGSVYFIQYQMDFGWLIRGLHHFGSQTMVVLLGLHMLQVVMAGAHLPPREVNWWLGLLLLGLILGLSLTGYLLPWDQKGYWATRVATNFLSNLPLLGAFLQKVIVGGPEYGHHTLSHFYALHVGIFPLLVIVVLIAHLAIFRRHGVTAPPRAQGQDLFWPAQAFKDLLASMVIFAIMLALVVFGGHGHKIDGPQPQGWYQQAAKAGQAGLGANLDAPADPDTEGYPARPEWYFLFLFQLLKYCQGNLEIIASVVIPVGVGLVLFLLPLLGFGRRRKLGHLAGVMVVVAFLAGAVILTLQALADDSPEPILVFTAVDVGKAKKFQEDLAKANQEARRAVHLAGQGIPEEGGRELLRKDPMIRGKKLFAQHCAVCHQYTLNHPENGFQGGLKGKFKAADLGGFASEKWIRALLENPGHPKFFGLTKLKGMKKWRTEIDEERDQWKESEKSEVYKQKLAEQDAEFDLLSRFLADQAQPKAKRDPDLFKAGIKAFFKRSEGCASCHHLEGGPRQGSSKAPDLSGYGSQDWIRLMVMSPGHPRRYHKAKNHMPAFRNLEGPGAEVHHREFRDFMQELDPEIQVIHLSDVERELIIRWLTGDKRVVFGGQPISGPVPSAP